MADDKIWKPLELIQVTAKYLTDKHVPSPRLDAEILLCHILGLARRVDLYAGFEREISGAELARYRDTIKRRTAREPVSRILGRREFMSLDFTVTPDVLSPRPETEILVEAALEVVLPKKRPAADAGPDEITLAENDEFPNGTAAGNSDNYAGNGEAAEMNRLLDSYAEDVDDEEDIDRPAVRPAPAAPPRQSRQQRPAPPSKATPPQSRKAAAPAPAGPPVRVLDLGTGSGAIAVAFAAHCPAARVVAVDASPKALAVAKKNAAAAGVAERVEFRQGDWFAACREGEVFDLILSNPPYLVEGDADIWPEARDYDPPLALYGGRDGLDCYRRIIPDAADRLSRRGLIFLEVADGQAERVAEMLSRRGFVQAEVIKDYAGTARVVKAAAAG